MAAKQAGAEGVIVLEDDLMFRERTPIAELELRERLPAMYAIRQHVVAGGLLAYGPNTPAMFRRAAGCVDRILKGERPADIPIEQPMRFDFVINLKTAQALGITIPQPVLLDATEVIQ